MDREEEPAHASVDVLSPSVPTLSSLLASFSGELIPATSQEYGQQPDSQASLPPSAPSSGMPSPTDPSTFACAPIHSLFETTPSSVESEQRCRSRRAAAMAAREAITSSVKRTDRLVIGMKRSHALPVEEESKSFKFARFFEDEQSYGIAPKSTKPPPNAKDDANYETDDVKSDGITEEKCCICMCEPERQELAVVNNCSHRFCFDCIVKWGERENTCPLCKSRFTKISRVHKAKRRLGIKTPPNTKHVRERNQRSDLISGAALGAMLNSLAASNRASLGLGGSALGATRVSRVVFAMGGGSGGARRVHFASRHTSRRATLFVEEGLLESDEDSSDGVLNPVDFNELMRQTMNLNRRRDVRFRSRRTPFIGLDGTDFQVPHSLGSAWMVPSPPSMFGSFHPQPSSRPPPPQRSYAVNTHDSSAGRLAENPIEIDDSDDDDVVEVIVPSPASST